MKSLRFKAIGADVPIYKIRPLEWEKSTHSLWRARFFHLSYEIEMLGQPGGNSTGGYEFRGENYRSLNKAKEAAQEHVARMLDPYLEKIE